MVAPSGTPSALLSTGIAGVPGAWGESVLGALSSVKV